jgi:CubicO group peptidase (beta-lactamase class C family)
MTSQFKTGEPGATVLVAKAGKVLYHKALGMANMELDVRSDTSMVYYIGSNTKQFTTVAILQLVEKGMISLEDTLGKYVNSVPPVSGITIRQLLSHTSGLNGDAYVDSLHIPKGDNRQAEIERYAAKKMAFPAGSKWQYNNANFQTLGYILEKITGKTYAEYVSEHLFKPAGMKTAIVVNNDEQLIKNRPAGYGILRRGIINMSGVNKQDYFASGGILASARDMFNWSQALRSGILLHKDTLQLAFTPQTLTNGKTAPYGFGWYIDTIKGSVMYRHGGAIPGFISETIYMPVENVYIVMLINSESAVMPQVLTRLVGAQLIGKPYNFHQSAVPPQYTGNYAGVYETDRGELVNITEVGGKVFWQRVNGRRYEVKQSVKDQFYFDQEFLWLEFYRNEKNEVTQLVFSRAGYLPLTWKKTNRPIFNLSDTGKKQ